MAVLTVDISEDDDGTGEPIEFTFAANGLDDVSIGFGSDVWVTVSMEQFQRLFDDVTKWWTADPEKR